MLSPDSEDTSGGLLKTARSRTPPIPEGELSTHSGHSALA
jgi:hypothetical protein